MRALTALGALVCLLAACTGGVGDDDALAERVAALEAVAESATPTATAVRPLPPTEPAPPAPPTATPTPTPTPTAAPPPSVATIPAPASPGPTPAPVTETVAPPQTRYITDTGGTGVSRRNDCLDSARTGQEAFVEGERVQREARGINRCEGWSRVRAGDRESWVRNGYLSAAPPPASTPAPRVATATPTPAPAPTRAPTPTPLVCEIPEAAAKVVASTVKVTTGGGSIGTAFYIGNSEFVTAAHVVEGEHTVRLSSPDLDVTAQVVGLDNGLDVAILSASTSLPAIEWGDYAALAVGEAVATAGYAAGLGDRAAVSSGRVSRVFVESGTWIVQTDAAVSPGNSGGPLFDACGAVVGMVTSKIVGEGVEGIGFALAESTIRGNLAAVRSAAPPPTPRPATWLYESDGEYESVGRASSTPGGAYLVIGCGPYRNNAFVSFPVGSTFYNDSQSIDVAYSFDGEDQRRETWVGVGTGSSAFSPAANAFVRQAQASSEARIRVRSHDGRVYLGTFDLSGLLGAMQQLTCWTPAPASGPTDAEIDAYANALLDRWGAAYDELLPIWDREYELLEAGAHISEELADLGDRHSFVAFVEGEWLENDASPARENPTVEAFVQAGWAYWEAEKEAGFAVYWYAHGRSWATIEVVFDKMDAAADANYAVFGVLCALAEERGYSDWLNYDGEYCY